MCRIMRTLIGAMLLLCAVNVNAQMDKQTIQWQGENREYYLFEPSSRQLGDSLAVLVFLHGFDGGIDSYCNSIDFQQAANQMGWIILLPQALEARVEFMGTSLSIGNAWNSGIAMSLMGNTIVPNSNVDDAGFLLALVDSVDAAYPIRSDSIFFAGFSMGAFMTYRMAIQHADRIAGAAAASGLIPICWADSVPARPLPILHIHGTDDQMIASDGTATPIPGMGQMTLGLSVDSTLSYWRHFDQCDATATITTYDNSVDDGLLFTLYTYGGGLENTQVAFLSVDGGGHQWYEEGHDVQYLTVIHDFFTGHNSYQHSGISNPYPNQRLICYPNPVSQSLVVDSPCSDKLYIYNAAGICVDILSLTEGNNTINTSTYPAGRYMLRTSLGMAAQIVVK